jgi:hypothetical protein
VASLCRKVAMCPGRLPTPRPPPLDLRGEGELFKGEFRGRLDRLQGERVSKGEFRGRLDRLREGGGLPRGRSEDASIARGVGVSKGEFRGRLDRLREGSSQREAFRGRLDRPASGSSQKAIAEAASIGQRAEVRKKRLPRPPRWSKGTEVLKSGSSGVACMVQGRGLRAVLAAWVASARRAC